MIEERDMTKRFIIIDRNSPPQKTKKKFTITDRKIFTITDRNSPPQKTKKKFTITDRKIFTITDMNSPPSPKAANAAKEKPKAKTKFTITDSDPQVPVKTRRRYSRIPILPRISE
jgi:hypothetical protein